MQEGGDSARLRIAGSCRRLRDIAGVDSARTVENEKWMIPLKNEREELKQSVEGGDVDTSGRPNARIFLPRFSSAFTH